MIGLVKRMAVLFVLANLMTGCAYFSVLHHNLERSFGTQTTSKSN